MFWSNDLHVQADLQTQEYEVPAALNLVTSNYNK